MGNLLANVGSGVEGEVDASLDILTDLVNNHLSKMAPFAILVKVFNILLCKYDCLKLSLSLDSFWSQGWKKRLLPLTIISYFFSPYFPSSSRQSFIWYIFSPVPAKPKWTLGLHSVRLSVHSISFPDFFLKRLQILTWFLACQLITMTYRSSLSFVTLSWLFGEITGLGLSKFQRSNSFLQLFS